MTAKLERNAMLSVRTYPETKDKLKELAELMSKRLGTKITQAQALEITLANAVKAEK